MEAMNYILSVSFANEKVATKSYENLHETSADEQVIVLDNNYPMRRANGRNWLRHLCERLRFVYIDAGYNMGLYDAYNHLINTLPDKCESVILHDGDHFINQEGWTQAAFAVMKDPTVATCIVSNKINQRELNERGFTASEINGQKVKVSHEVICCSVSAWSVPFLKSVKGITSPNRYYGGNELEMWKYYGADRKLVVLDDYTEDLDTMKTLQDWQYEEYKLLYAHRGLGMSFDEFLKTNPVRQGADKLLKEIFG